MPVTLQSALQFRCPLFFSPMAGGSLIFLSPSRHWFNVLCVHFRVLAPWPPKEAGMVVAIGTVLAGTAATTFTPIGKRRARRKETVAGSLPGTLSSLQDTDRNHPVRSGPPLRWRGLLAGSLPLLRVRLRLPSWAQSVTRLNEPPRPGSQEHWIRLPVSCAVLWRPRVEARRLRLKRQKLRPLPTLGTLQ